MADRKITDLTALAAGSQATGDLLTIVDVSESAAADKNKKITVESLFKGIPGNVGIGTASPGKKLQVDSADFDTALFKRTTSTGSATIFLSNTSNHGAALQSLGNGAGGLALFTQTSNALSERLRIDSSGQVGIGTSSPSSPLHVKNAGSTACRFILENSGSASDDSTQIWSQNNDLAFNTNDSERMRIDSSGNLLIGLSSAVGISGTPADLNSTEIGRGYINISRDDTQAADHILFGKNGSVASSIGTSTTNSLTFKTGTTERMRIDSSGQVGIGSSSPGHELVVRGSQPFLELRSSDTGNHAGEDVFSGILFGTDDTSTSVDPHGFIKAVHTRAGSGHSSADAGLTFGTSASTTAPATERMRITSDGDLLIGQSSTDTPGFGNTTLGAAFENLGADGVAIFASRSGNVCAGFNRAQDGDIIHLASAGSIEGTISISGTTTSYNGAHLSRWSQLAGNAERIEILRGSVLSNIDEMCEWGEEDNEQLNRMKVSDVEGDVNVSGVFQAWDDDDDTYTNDFYCAMTGDFVIRIAQGTTVARGDLLMSAGDGTAKPQDDDIVRSKTIAKVTSTTVSTTYADGSYCVPCVLMAC